MNKSVYSQVYDSILDDIFNHSFTPGQILNERMLIETYGCSKTTLREVLVALCHENIIRNIPRYGYEVLRVEISEITDILEYRYVLETGCLTRCFHSITPRHLIRLRELNDRCCGPTLEKDPLRHWDHNAAFHLELVSLSGNRYAHRQLMNALDTLKRAYGQYHWDKRNCVDFSSDTHNHELLLAALERRDLPAACSALGKDLKEFAY